MCVKRKILFPCAGILRQSCIASLGIHYSWTSRLAGFHKHVSRSALPSTQLPANNLVPNSEPCGLKVRDIKADTNSVSLLAMSDKGSVPQEQPLMLPHHHLQFSQLVRRRENSIFSAASKSSQTWHPIAIYKQFCLHMFGSDIVQELANPDGPLINSCTSSP